MPSNEERSKSSLKKPKKDADYSSFPVHNRRAELRAYRVHQQNDPETGELRSPWYYSSHAGRFNLQTPRGTLNCATKDGTAVREALGKVLVGSSGKIDLPDSAVEGLVVSYFCTPELRLADFTVPQATAFGIVPGDVAAPFKNGYKKTRLWAAAMDDHFGGIYAGSRFATDNGNCIFIFGDEGVQEGPEPLSFQTVEDFLRETMPWVTLHGPLHSTEINILD